LVDRDWKPTFRTRIAMCCADWKPSGDPEFSASSAYSAVEVPRGVGPIGSGFACRAPQLLRSSAIAVIATRERALTRIILPQVLPRHVLLQRSSRRLLLGPALHRPRPSALDLLGIRSPEFDHQYINPAIFEEPSVGKDR